MGRMKRAEMNAEELEKIVARDEMQCLELKESFNVECIETACAFANAQGGFIVIGVDNKGNPSKHQLRFEGLRDYENKISTATEPSVAVDAEKVEFVPAPKKASKKKPAEEPANLFLERKKVEIKPVIIF